MQGSGTATNSLMYQPSSTREIASSSESRTSRIAGRVRCGQPKLRDTWKSEPLGLAATRAMDATAKDLPAAVREQPADKTSVYQAGQLVYDGATGERHGSAAGGADGAPRGPGGTLNEMLQWGIANSDPAELERRAGAGAAPPSRVDQEILDHILGQPTVAGMRANLGKLEPEAIESDGGVEAAVAALEALEFDVECVDNANDLAKIGGIQAMLALCARAHRQPDLAEMACAVLATCMQVRTQGLPPRAANAQRPEAAIT